MKMKNVFVMNASLVLLLLASCSALKQKPAPIQPTEVLPATGVQYYFVTNELLIPTTQEQTKAFALNVDGDSQNSLDNKFGDLFTLLTSAAQGIELQATLDQAVDSGQVVSLHMVKANDLLNDPSVSWSIFLGQKTQSAPKFDGSDKFNLDSAAPANPPIVGSLTNGRFVGGPGATRIQMFLLGQPVEVGLIGVRLEADFSANGCANGKLGGGVTVDEFRAKILPAIVEGLNLIIKTDKAVADTLLPLFDSDSNGTLTIQEIEGNPLLMIALSPDLDLLDASGKFSPSQDGVKDSYSIGLGFTCVPATFTAPVE
ncbi:MAG: hypothetical protein Q7J80_00290 [Anaerolineales bacterium]|nr:hypothetical protein [Anaerolineales bacterium]